MNFIVWMQSKIVNESFEFFTLMWFMLQKVERPYWFASVKNSPGQWKYD